MKYPAYHKYKDSGVQWLGKIPVGWEINPLFSVLVEHYVQNIGMINSDVLSLSYGELILKDVSDNFGLLPESFETYQIVEPNDIILRLTDLQNDQRSLRTAISKHTGIITSAYIKLRCLQHAAFFHWQLYSIDTQKVFYGQGGGVRQSMKFSDLKRIPVVIPPIQTQKAISTFLDTETAKIDGLIKDYEELITLLQEKRQALISHAVTRGLSELVSPDDPEFGEWAKPVEFKDSGVEWLGEIPVGWTAIRLKHIAAISGGIAKGSGTTTDEVITVPYLRVANVQDGHLDLDEIATIEIDSSDLHRYLLKKGDVLMNEGGDNDKLGRGTVWTGEIDPCIHQNHVFKVRPYEVQSEWIDLFTSSNSAKAYFQQFAKQSTNLASISMTNLSNVPLTNPPRYEEYAIVDYLSKKTADLAELVIQVESAISLLKEHRSALITNAVTGKINVEALV